MSIGVTGAIRSSDVSIDDISVYYNFVSNRETSNTLMVSVPSASVLEYCTISTTDSEYVSGMENLIEGMYNLKLPASIFNQKGIYTIYLKPKSYIIPILDCGVLSAMPTTKGIIIDSTLLTSSALKSNNALQGYRIEYINQDLTKLRNVTRTVVTSNKVVPVQENVGSTSQKAIRYRLDDSGTLIFLQLTPSSPSEIKPNVLPFIGIPSQYIILSNTNFTPVSIEVEFVENTVQTLSDVLLGNQLKDVDNGILTLYDGEGIIRTQYDLLTYEDDITKSVSLEAKRKRVDNIDATQIIPEGI